MAAKTCEYIVWRDIFTYAFYWKMLLACSEVSAYISVALCFVYFKNKRIDF